MILIIYVLYKLNKVRAQLQEPLARTGFLGPLQHSLQLLNNPHEDTARLFLGVCVDSNLRQTEKSTDRSAFSSMRISFSGITFWVFFFLNTSGTPITREKDEGEREINLFNCRLSYFVTFAKKQQLKFYEHSDIIWNCGSGHREFSCTLEIILGWLSFHS